MKHFKNQVFFERNPAKFLKSAAMFLNGKQLCVFGGPGAFFRQKAPAGRPTDRTRRKENSGMRPRAFSRAALFAEDTAGDFEGGSSRPYVSV